MGDTRVPPRRLGLAIHLRPEHPSTSKGVCVFISSGQGPVRDFGTERALVEPLGPIYIDFPNLSPRFTFFDCGWALFVLTELNLNLKALA